MKKTFTFGFKIKYLMIIIIIGLTQIVFFFYCVLYPSGR